MSQRVDINNAFYIKLGAQGQWERECLKDGIIKFGYDETPHDLCERQDWDAVWNVWKEIRQNAGSATRDMNQIKTFYEASEQDIFITFHDGRLYWCQPAGSVTVLDAGPRYRGTVDGWHSTSVDGTALTTDKLSGHLLKTQMFRGTICTVNSKDYIARKINGDESPEIAASREAEQALIKANIDLMRLLTWQDFELLVDLIFSSSGWRRIGILGKTQKQADLELLLPTTGERGFVQVKSSTNTGEFLDYWQNYIVSKTYDRMFFVWHTGHVQPPEESDAILIGPDRLGAMIADAGLSSWLRQKVS